jgi:hypothetical protein
MAKAGFRGCHFTVLLALAACVGEVEPGGGRDGGLASDGGGDLPQR